MTNQPEYEVSLSDDPHQFRANRWKELDPDKRERAVKFLREWMESNHDADNPNYTVGDSIRAKMEDDGAGWITPYHFGFGMAVRNILRDAGFGEEYLEVWNLDDYYVSLLEVAAVGTPGWMELT